MARRIAFALIEHGRATEWLTSSVLLVFAAVLALPGDTLASPGFMVLREFGFDEAMVSTPLALVAAGRIVALYINGNWRRSPELRAVGAVIGSAIFGFLALSFGWPYLVGVSSSASTGAATYTVLALFDVLAAYRSGADVRLARHVRR
jgi:hypothetical protein